MGTENRYRYDMSIEEAAELARRSIYHATFRDGASGGVASGTLSLSLSACACAQMLMILIWFELLILISLLRGTWWMEEALWWWCWRTSLQILSSYAKYSGTGNGWGSWGISVSLNLGPCSLPLRDEFQDMLYGAENSSSTCIGGWCFETIHG